MTFCPLEEKNYRFLCCIHVVQTIVKLSVDHTHSHFVCVAITAVQHWMSATLGLFQYTLVLLMLLSLLIHFSVKSVDFSTFLAAIDFFFVFTAPSFLRQPIFTSCKHFLGSFFPLISRQIKKFACCLCTLAVRAEAFFPSLLLSNQIKSCHMFDFTLRHSNGHLLIAEQFL